MSSGAVQKDWNNREVSEMIQMQILKMTEFLNKFNLSTRHRLATIERRVSSLQRSLAFVEAALGVGTGQQAIASQENDA